MTFQVFRQLFKSLSENRAQAAQFVGLLTIVWAVMCLPIPIFEDRGYSLTTVSARDEGFGMLRNTSILGVAFVLLAIGWHQKVLLDGVTLTEKLGSRLFGYGIRWLGYLLLAAVLILGLLTVQISMFEEPSAADAQSDLGAGVLAALYVISVFALFLFFRGWTGLVAIAVNDPKVGYAASWRNTKPYRKEALLFAALLTLLYSGQWLFDEFLLGLELNGDTPEGAFEWAALFFWGIIWSLPAAIVLWLEVAFLTELYAVSMKRAKESQQD